MNLYKKLKIRDIAPGRYDLELDGKKIEGVKEAKVDFSLDSLPVLTVSVYVESVDIGTGD